MIVLDTNIISELMKVAPAENVITWVDSQVTAGLFVTSITIAEIIYGIEALPNGKRRDKLLTSFDTILQTGFHHRILDFNHDAAFIYGEIMQNSREKGHTMSICDGQIAAIARANQFSLATRNVKDFQHCGLQLINPF